MINKKYLIVTSIVIAIVVVMLILSVTLPSISRFGQTPEETQALITKRLDELLPSRDEISTEWWTGSSSNITSDESGFVEGKTVDYFKEFGEYSEMDVEFYVFRFSDVDSAKTYYDKKVNSLKSQGGYDEVAISGVFAVMYDYGTEEEGESWGVKSNIVFGVYVYNDYILESPKGELVDFTNLLKNKIG